MHLISSSEYKHVLGLPPSAAGPFQHASMPLSARYMCHWLPCGRAKRVRRYACSWASAPCRRLLSAGKCHGAVLPAGAVRNVLGLPPSAAGLFQHASMPLSARYMCHWLPCGRAKRVRHIVYRAFELGLRPLPPASLSKYSYYYEYKYVIGLPPSAAVPFQYATIVIGFS